MNDESKVQRYRGVGRRTTAIRWGTVLGLVLLLTVVARAQAGGLRSLPAQPPPPLPQTTATVSQRSGDVWRLTKVVRLGQEVRFALLVRKTEPGQSITRAVLSLRQTHLKQDGVYLYGATISSVPMHRSILPDGDILFVRTLHLQDTRMVGKTVVEFDVSFSQGEFVPDLLLTVKPVTGNIPGGDPRTAAYWGLQMSVSLPRSNYPRDALVLATAQVRNVSNRARTIQSGYCSRPPWIEVLAAHGWVLPRPFQSAGPTCAGVISTTIPPGRSVTRYRYVVASSDRLRVAATIGDIHVHGAPVRIHLEAATAPSATVTDTGAAITVRLRPRQPVAGLLHYGFRIDCARSGHMVPVLGSNGWRSLSGNTLSVQRPTYCDPAAPWAYHALTGWIGQSVARVDVVSTKPESCDHGMIGRQPSLPAVSPKTLDAIGISLLAPASRTGVCEAHASYQVQLSLTGSAPRRAVLAQVASDTDSLINGHLAWAILSTSLDPNHPTNPPVLYLSFVDARSGALLDTVYAGGLHPPGPPIHLRLPPNAAEVMVLSGTRQIPRVSQAKAQQVMASAPGGHGASVREVVLARVYDPNTPTLRDHLCWIFSVIPPDDSVIGGHVSYWLIYIDAETGKLLMAGGSGPPGGLTAALRPSSG